MNDELFTIPEQLSPRLAWMKKHAVTTERAPHMKEGEEPWSAWVGNVADAINRDAIGTGETENEAIAEVAIIHGWPLWNEEQPSKPTEPR